MIDKNMVSYGDLVFERDPACDYQTSWSKHFTDRLPMNVTRTVESAILFAAKEGVDSFKSSSL